MNESSYCVHCGKENPLGKTNFCPYCGMKDPYVNAICPYYHGRECSRWMSEFEQGIWYGRTGEIKTRITEVKGECWGAGPEIEACPCEGKVKECPRRNK